MLNQATIEKMHAMKMSAMADVFERQLATPRKELAFDESVAMLIDAEWESRQQRRLTRRLQVAKLRYSASIEDLDFKPRRGLDRRMVMALATCDWIRESRNLIITGPTGVGKTYLACAFAEKACRSSLTAWYMRLPRLLHSLAVSRGDGSYERLLAKLTRTQLLVIDDWLLSPIKESERRDLLELFEERYERGSTLLTSQLPVSAWHDAFDEPTHADAICDRIVHGAHRVELKGPSMRQLRAPAVTTNTKMPAKAK
jgi:DNA replication protein DnaC